MSDLKKNDSLIKKTAKRLDLFFDDAMYTRDSIEEGLEIGDIFIEPGDMLPYLQTALLDEKVLEVELDGMTRVYFSRLHDHPPEPEDNQEGEEEKNVDDYTAGDYLKAMNHLVSLPLEPGIGNVHIRQSKRVVVRMFINNYAVEFGCFYQDMMTVNDIPVLRLDYPSIGRIVRGAREFRAKVPGEFELNIVITGKRRQSSMNTRVADISASGCSFQIKKEEQELFRIDETRTFEFIQEELVQVGLSGTIRHVSKIRGKEGTEYIAGLQFDLVTRALAAEVEKIVASVQRAHLKELSELSESSGLDLKT